MTEQTTTTEGQPQTTQAPTPAPAAQDTQAPKAEQPKIDRPKIKVSVKDHPKGKRPGFDPNDAQARKAWLAQKHKEHQEALTKCGYTPAAVIAIMRYLTNNHGYEKSRAKDHLILMFEHLSRSFKYLIPVFNRDISSQVAVLLIDINSHLTSQKDLFSMSDEDSMKFTMQTFDRVWKTAGGVDAKAFTQIKGFFLSAINKKYPEGYAKRARYFIECIIDTTMKMVDPFEGLFHDQELEMPPEIKKFMKPKYKHPEVLCPKCGKPMKWIFPLKKHICNNSLCEDYRPPRKKSGDGQQKQGPRKGGEYFSGKPVEQKTGADRFAAKYGKRNERTFVSAPTVKKEVNGKEVEVKKRFSGGSMADALAAAGLGVAKAPETPAPAAEAPAAEAPKAE